MLYLQSREIEQEPTLSCGKMALFKSKRNELEISNETQHVPLLQGAAKLQVVKGVHPFPVHTHSFYGRSVTLQPLDTQKHLVSNLKALIYLYFEVGGVRNLEIRSLKYFIPGCFSRVGLVQYLLKFSLSKLICLESPEAER